MIYFIGNVKANVCKIGFSDRPLRRIETLRKESIHPLDIFDIIEGTMDDEKKLHGIYAEHRIKGEWYHLDAIKETGIRKETKKIGIKGLPFYYNPNNGFVNITILTRTINSFRVKNRQCIMNFCNYEKANKQFLSSFGINPIQKDYHNWVHPFVAIDFASKANAKIKLAIYENMDKLEGVVRLANLVPQTLK